MQLVQQMQVVQSATQEFRYMNTEHRYIFEKGSKKHLCPGCAKKRFVRYIDTETGEYLPDQYGRCDRESKCGYFLNPYTDGYVKAIREQEQGDKTDWKPLPPKRIKKPLDKPKTAFIPVEVLSRTRTGYEQNTFIQNLHKRVAFPFESQDLEKVISLYHLGTVQNGYRKGANTFPFIDIKDNVRAVQVKQFDNQNNTKSTDFLHSIIGKHHAQYNEPLPEWLRAYNMNETKVSCLFGEHLLSRCLHNPIALVEAPKSAIYGALYFGFPEQQTNLLWLAVYNLSSLNVNKCTALKGRNVYLFPDLSKDGGAFKLWSNKANDIQKQLQGTYFHVSDLLEKLAPQQDKEQGKDIADYLIKQDWRLFRQQELQSETEEVETVIREKSEKCEAPKKTIFSQPVRIEQPIKEQPTNWSDEIAELENYFRSITLPTEPFKLDNGSTIYNCQIFIDSHLAIVKANNGERTFLPYLNRLRELKEAIDCS